MQDTRHKKNSNHKWFLGIVCFLFLVSCFLEVRAQVMSSTNYRIESDSVNIGGTEDSSSASYQIRDTLGEIATGPSTSSSYNLYAGYRQMEMGYISITSPADVSMSPSIAGVSGGSSDGSAQWSVATDNTAGYSLTVKADSSPALRSSSDSFADYTPAGADPDYDWLISTSDSEFGFSPGGNDILQKYKDDGIDCNVGSNDTPDKCWYYFDTSDEAIAQSSSSNHPAGTATTVKFKAESGSGHLQSQGTYTATITVTAVTI